MRISWFQHAPGTPPDTSADRVVKDLTKRVAWDHVPRHDLDPTTGGPATLTTGNC
jgi:hypothetical protein